MSATQLEYLGLQDYESVWARMLQFTSARQADTPDRIWITEHPPVYTLGLNSKPEHLLVPTSIPVVKTDRGGQITYHGPGQLVIYPLVNIKRLQWGPRQWVTVLEQAIIACCQQYGITAQAQAQAPGVYVEGKKIASLGLRIKSGFSYHGVSINNCMDLRPFSDINPCGYSGLGMTQLADQGVNVHNHELAVPIIQHILKAIDA